MSAPVMRTEGLCFGYRGEPVLREVDLKIRQGEFLAILGPNGAGKSTLLKLLSGWLEPESGRVLLGEEPLEVLPRREVARRVGVVPQEFSFYFAFTVEEVLRMGRHPYQGPGAVSDERDRRAVERALADAGLTALRDRSVLALSGGEKQRVLLASALAQAEQVLLLDEPTASLDLRFQVSLHEVLARRNREEGLTIVSVSHDANLAGLYADRILLMVDGRVVEDGPPAEVLTSELLHRHFGVRVQVGVHGSGGRPFLVPLPDGGDE